MHRWVAGVGDIWIEIFSLREYPGFDGQQLRIHCPTASSYLPSALMEYDAKSDPKPRNLATVF